MHRLLPIFRAFAVLCLSASSLLAHANVMYTYTGNNYNNIVLDETPPAGATFNTSQRVTGSLTFSSLLADMALGDVSPVAFSFSNGVHTFTQNDSLAFTIHLQVAAGVITH